MASILSAGTTSATAMVHTADTSGVLQLASNNGVVAVTVDTSQNFLIGVTTGSNKLTVAQTKATSSAESYNLLRLSLSGTRALNDTVGIRFGATGSSVDIGAIACISGADDALYGTLTFSTRSFNTDTLVEAFRIDNRSNLLVNRTTVLSSGQYCADYDGNSRRGIVLNNSTATSGANLISFASAGSVIANISQSGASTVAYGTSSDYRLKEDISPMTGALSVVQQLKPVTYKWKFDGSEGQGFIAHELAEVVPDCVQGEKDAVDADGNPQYQSIDTSFLVATLTAAIQELNAKVTALENK